MVATKRAWSVAKAKAHFSQVITDAETQGAQTITRHGKPAVIVVSAKEWGRRPRQRGSLADFFAASPLAGSGLDLQRSEGRPRKIVL